MADVRCSMCGKLNPEGSDVCRYCGARLTPLIPASNPPPPSNPPEPAGGDEPDWLSELRTNDAAAAPQEDVPSEDDTASPEPSDADVPDWLSRVRQRNDVEKTPFDPFGLSASDGDEAPDWLKGLSGSVPAGGETAPSSEPSEESALPLGLAGEEWLSKLKAQDAPPEPVEPEPDGSAGPTQPATPGESEDWLAGLQGFTAPESEPPTPAPAAGSGPVGAETDLSAWLRGLDETAGAQPSAAEPSHLGESADAEEPAAWFNDAEFEAPSQPGAETAGTGQPADEGAGLPSWLAQTAAPQSGAPEGEGEGEVPAWLSSFAAETPAAPEASQTPAEGIPDWLSQAKPPVSDEAAPELTGEPLAEETPAWLSELQQPEGETPAPAAGGEEEIPSWMQPGEAAQEPAQPSEIPAWMQPVETPPPAQEPARPGEMPDFSALFANEETPVAEAPAGEEAAPVGAAAEEAAGVAENEIPDWLKGFGKAGQVQDEAGAKEQAAEAAAETTPAASPPFVDENLPSWLSQIKPPAGAPEAEETISPLLEPEEKEPAADLGEPFKVDLPAWMDKEAEAPIPAVEAEAAQAEQPEEELEPAELPSWVEDLRPLESVIPGEVQADANEVKVEKAGPLAGMRGLLQGEELATRYRKLPTYSARLRISERQRAHAQLLENVLADEAHPQEIPSEPSRAPQLILRVIIALLLVLALLPMLIPGFQLVPVPTAYPAGLTSLYNQVDALPANAPVLLAVDYEPGLSGEMRFAGNAVLEHLMVKSARMTFVSTVPTGPVLADQMLREVQSRRQEYNLAEQTVNLGYLPGGTTSLLEFAQNPRGAAPVALDTALTGLMAWDRPALQNVNRLQDFTLVIVLTDSAETGRAWIEQVKPQMGGVPLAMVASAQAGPLLQPYLDSGQINGLSVGLMGGAMYEQKSGRINLANQYWGSFQSGSLAGLLLLIVGGVFSVIFSIAGWNRKRKA